MNNPGKLLILLMVVAGLGAGALGVWYRHGQMNQVLETLSPRVAELLGNAPQAALARLEPVDKMNPSSEESEQETIDIADKTYRITDRRDASESKALGNLRKALLRNASYEWEQPPADAPGDWTILVIVRRGEETARLAIDPAGWLLLPAGNRVISIAPVTPGLKLLVREQFPELAERDPASDDP